MSPVTAVSGVVLFIGFASFGVFACALHRILSLDRALELGDVAVSGVFLVFGAFCVGLGWLLLRNPAQGAASGAPAENAAPRRVTLSHGCATAGVLLLMLSVLVPAHWHPVMLFFAGLALLAVSHVLTPCEERLAKLRRARESLRQL